MQKRGERAASAAAGTVEAEFILEYAYYLVRGVFGNLKIYGIKDGERDKSEIHYRKNYKVFLYFFFHGALPFSFII